MNKFFKGIGFYLVIFIIIVGIVQFSGKPTQKVETLEFSKVYRELTEDELIQYKEEKRLNNTSLQKRLEGKVFVTSISEYGEGYDWNLTTEPTRRNNPYYKGINSYKGLVIYGFKEDQVKLEKALTIFAIARPNYFENDFYKYYIPK